MEVDCHSVRQKVESGTDFLLLDCREADELQLASIPGAVHIPMSQIQDRVQELAPWTDREIVVFCHHGVRSQRVAAWLAQQGFASTYSMSGGIDAWSRQIDPEIGRY